MIALTTMSCDDFLDVKPTGKRMPETVKDYSMMLADYREHGEALFNIYLKSPELKLSDGLYKWLWGGTVYQKQYMWRDHIYTESMDDSDWTKNYHTIHVSNTILDNIDDAELGNDPISLKNHTIANAYGTRALTYWYLINIYGPSYTSNNLDELTIPLALSAKELDYEYKKEKLKDVYEQIFSDIEKAEEYAEDLPIVNTKNRTQMSVAGLKGLKAWMYQTIDDHENALKYANEALTLYDYIYDYNDLTLEYRGPFKYVKENGKSFHLYTSDDKENIVGRVGEDDWTYNFVLMGDELVDMLEGSSDLRWEYYSTTYDNWGLPLSNNQYGINWYTVTPQVGITTPLMTLIKAESEARTNKGSEAIQTLNDFREKRVKSGEFEPYSYVNDQDVIDKIINERMIEFMGTGFRFLDLKRLHGYGEATPTYTRTIEEETVTLEPGSDQFIMPISLKIQNANSNLKE